MKTIKMILGTVLTVFLFPAVIIHELSHAIVTCLFFQKVKGISIWFPYRFNKPLRGLVDLDSKKIEGSFTMFMISMSPLFSLFFFIALAVYYPIFWYVVIYQVLAYVATLPSEGDLYNAFLFFGACVKARNYKCDDSFVNWLFPEWSTELSQLNDNVNTLSVLKMFEEGSEGNFGVEEYEEMEDLSKDVEIFKVKVYEADYYELAIKF